MLPLFEGTVSSCAARAGLWVHCQSSLQSEAWCCFTHSIYEGSQNPQYKRLEIKAFIHLGIVLFHAMENPGWKLHCQEA